MVTQKVHVDLQANEEDVSNLSSELRYVFMQRHLRSRQRICQAQQYYGRAICELYAFIIQYIATYTFSLRHSSKKLRPISIGDGRALRSSQT